MYKMPTEQQMIDAIVLDEDVPHFIKLENQKIRSLFKTARHRRGVKREEAFEELQELIESLLLSQYRSYVGVIGQLKIKAAKAWIDSEAGRRVAFMEERIEKLLLREQDWKNALQRVMEEKSELSIKLKTTDNEKGYEADSGEDSC